MYILQDVPQLIYVKKLKITQGVNLQQFSKTTGSWFACEYYAKLFDNYVSSGY